MCRLKDELEYFNIFDYCLTDNEQCLLDEFGKVDINEINELWLCGCDFTCEEEIDRCEKLSRRRKVTIHKSR